MKTFSGKRGGQETSTSLVSVIILTYQRFDFIFDAIDSVLEQDYPEIELIISDDGSDLFPSEKIEHHIQNNKCANIKQVVLLRMAENLGTVRHANKAAAGASGDYIRFLGADDTFFDPHVISDTISFMRESQTLVSTSITAAYDERLNNILYYYPTRQEARQLNSLPPEKLFGFLAVNGNVVGASGAIFRKEFFEQGGFDVTYSLTEDFPTWLRLFRELIRIPCMMRVTVKYRTNGISSKKFKGSHIAQVLFSELGKTYKKEILEYPQFLTRFQKRYSEFVYSRIIMINRFSLLPKLFFFVRYFDIVLWRKIAYLKKKVIRYYDRLSLGDSSHFDL